MKAACSLNETIFLGGYEKYVYCFNTNTKEIVFKNYVVHDVVGIDILSVEEG